MTTLIFFGILILSLIGNIALLDACKRQKKYIGNLEGRLTKIQPGEITTDLLKKIWSPEKKTRKNYYYDLISKHLSGSWNGFLLITKDDLDKLAEKLNSQTN